MIMWDDWLCISRNAIIMHGDLLCLVNMLDDYMLHDIAAHLFKSLIYFNLCHVIILPCCMVVVSLQVHSMY